MDNDQKLDLLKTWYKEFNAVDKRMSKLNKMFSASPESKFSQPIYSLMASYTDVVAKLLGDSMNWLEWFAFENAMGMYGLEAGYEEDMRKIHTLEDLLWLLDGNISGSK